MTPDDTNPMEPALDNPTPLSVGLSSLLRDHAIMTPGQIRAFCLYMTHLPTLCDELGLDFAEVDRVARRRDDIGATAAVAGFDFPTIPLGVPLEESPEPEDDAAQLFLPDPLPQGPNP